MGCEARADSCSFSIAFLMRIMPAWLAWQTSRTMRLGIWALAKMSGRPLGL